MCVKRYDRKRLSRSSSQVWSETWGWLPDSMLDILEMEVSVNWLYPYTLQHFVVINYGYQGVQCFRSWHLPLNWPVTLTTPSPLIRQSTKTHSHSVLQMVQNMLHWIKCNILFWSTQYTAVFTFHKRTWSLVMSIMQLIGIEILSIMSMLLIITQCKLV